MKQRWKDLAMRWANEGVDEWLPDEEYDAFNEVLNGAAFSPHDDTYDPFAILSSVKSELSQLDWAPSEAVQDASRAHPDGSMLTPFCALREMRASARASDWAMQYCRLRCDAMNSFVGSIWRTLEEILSDSAVVCAQRGGLARRGGGGAGVCAQRLT